MTTDAPAAGAPVEVPAADEAQAILEWLDEKPTLSRFVSAARRLDQLHERDNDRFASRRVAVVRNITIEPIEPLLKVAAARAGLHVTIDYSGYDPAPGDELDELVRGDPDVVLLLMRLEGLAPPLMRDVLETPAAAVPDVAAAALDRVMTLVSAVRERCRATVFVHNFVVPRVPAAGLADTQRELGQINVIRRMNVDLAHRARESGSYVIDLDQLFARIGLDHCYDERGERVSGAPFSQAALRGLADLHVRSLVALSGPQVKCLVVDCDGTLWGGIIGEDGITGIELGGSGAGQRFVEFQRALLDLRRRGIVLAICSKNDRDDVIEVFRSHPECVLGEDDFAAMRINWDPKPDNLREIAEELNLAFEHIAFMDDDPVQSDWVRTALPALRVIECPDGSSHDRLLENMWLFDTLDVTEEDRDRTRMYQAEAKRRTSVAEAASPEDYLRSLEMVATVGRAGPEHLARLAQLTQRTNQFNLTTRRYEVGAMEELARDSGSAVVWLELRDRFGGHGIVGCGIVRTSDDGSAAAVIDTLLLSCRVLGRRVETLLVNRLAAQARDLGAKTLVGQYIPTARNRQVADLYERLGFTAVAGDSQQWELDLAVEGPAVPDWFRVFDSEGIEGV